ncbi:MAG: hypothetical protein ABIT38_04510, partial [Gemmatimonadaceae bacterium]
MQAPPSTPRLAPEVTASIAAATIGGIPGFRFEAPIVPGQTPGDPRTFDGTLEDLLSVQICE